MALAAGLLFVVITALTAKAQDVFVTVEQGTLRGSVQTSVFGVPYYQFLSIPYAQPPVGELRFAAPQPPSSWEGVRDVLEATPMCAQAEGGSEDCLYLHVSVPVNLTEPAATLLWIPGGGFFSGDGGPDLNGPDFLIEQGVIVISFSYRLGPFGFLSTQDEVIAGNWGLKDQAAALQWVRNNIAAFGGDPDRITVGGASAGGCSAAHHQLSPVNNGQMAGLILESGHALSSWAIMQDARDKAFRLGEVLGLSTNDSQELLQFLRAQDASDLAAHDNDVITDAEKVRIQHLAWTPVVEPDMEGAFLTEEPITLLREGRFNKVPFITGFTSADGSLLVADKGLLTNSSALQELNDNYLLAIAPILHVPTWQQKLQAAIETREFYFGGEQDITLDDAQQIVDLTTDTYFDEPGDSTARFVANQSDVTVYSHLFDYRGPELGDATYGAPHAVVYNVLLLTSAEDPVADRNSTFGRLRDNLVRLFSNFIKYQTPTPEGEEIVWLPFTNADLNYMHITDGFQMEQNVLQERMDFWHENIPW